MAVALTAALGLAGRPAAAEVEPLLFEFERYNDTYTGLVAAVRPVERGPLSIRLSSPRSEMTLVANRLEVEPDGVGLHRGRIWGRFFGAGELVAEVELGAIPARFADRVKVLEQEKEIAAQVEIEPHPDGYRITLVELPASVSVAIESDLVGRLIAFCRSFSLFVIGDGGCGALDQVLSNPRLPLPEKGSRFVVLRESFTVEEVARIDDYLAAAAEPDPSTEL